MTNVSQRMLNLGTARSEIREAFAFAQARAAEVGAENVDDFSIGNPSVPAPATVAEAVRRAGELHMPEALLVKPEIDQRDGAKFVASRMGLCHACIYFSELAAMPEEQVRSYACVIVDEAQFLSRDEVQYLVRVVDDWNVPVICYGLRADFSLRGFPGSTRLLELAHTIEEMKTICTCGRKAICNCRKVNGQFVFEGEQVAIDLENDVQYVSMCPQCYFRARRAFYAGRK